MPGQARQAEPFGNHTLASKSRIAVQQNRHHLGAGLVTFLRLFGADLAQNHRVHRLKMARVGGQRQMHRVAVEFAVGRCAQMVFHVTRTVHVFGFERPALNFIKNRAVGFAHDVCQDA
jgi:hypothetical protein